MPFFTNKFPGLFQDFPRTQIDFSRTLKLTLTPTIPRSQYYFSLLPSVHFIFSAEFNRFPELSRTSGLFPGLSSPGKCHNEIPGLSMFSRTRTNPVLSILSLRECGICYHQNKPGTAVIFCQRQGKLIHHLIVKNPSCCRLCALVQLGTFIHTELKVNDQLVAYATRCLAVRLKKYVWSHHRALKAKV